MPAGETRKLGRPVRDAVGRAGRAHHRDTAGAHQQDRRLSPAVSRGETLKPDPLTSNIEPLAAGAEARENFRRMASGSPGRRNAPRRWASARTGRDSTSPATSATDLAGPH